MLHPSDSSDEYIGASLSALGLVSESDRTEPYDMRRQGGNYVLLPRTRGLRDIGRLVFGLRPDPLAAIRRPMLMPVARFALLEETASNLTGTPASIAGFRIGSGGRRKLTVAFANEQGPIAVAQFPLVDLAKDSLAHQEKTIGFLGQCEGLAQYLPEVISSVEIGGNEGFLFSTGPSRRVRRIDNDVISFLIDLQAATSRKRMFSESGLVKSWLARLDAWRTQLGPHKCSILERAIYFVQDWLDVSIIDLSVAHGDFTRWNLRRGERGLFVFDWEASVLDSLPYHDLFHFFAAESALLRRPSPTSSLRWRRVQNMAERITPSWISLLTPLYVGYLVETTLWYTRSREWNLKTQAGPFWRFLWAELDQVGRGTRLST